QNVTGGQTFAIPIFFILLYEYLIKEKIGMTQTNTSVKAPFKGDHVGSFLRPERIKQARIQKENGEITAKQLRNIEDTEIIKLVEIGRATSRERYKGG